MVQRIAITIAWLVATASPALAQKIVASNQLVRYYDNDGTTLGNADAHFVITVDVEIKELAHPGDWKKLRAAIVNKKPLVARPLLTKHINGNGSPPAESVIDAVMTALPQLHPLGTPPNVDIETLEDFQVQGSLLASPDVRAHSVRPVAPYTFRIHLDVPITTQLADLDTALTNKNACAARDIVKANVIAIGANAATAAVRSIVTTALGCGTPW